MLPLSQGWWSCCQGSCPASARSVSAALRWSLACTTHRIMRRDCLHTCVTWTPKSSMAPLASARKAFQCYGLLWLYFTHKSKHGTIFQTSLFGFMYTRIWANRTNISMSNTNVRVESRREKMDPLKLFSVPHGTILLCARLRDGRRLR